MIAKPEIQPSPVKAVIGAVPQFLVRDGKCFFATEQEAEHQLRTTFQLCHDSLLSPAGTVNFRLTESAPSGVSTRSKTFSSVVQASRRASHKM